MTLAATADAKGSEIAAALAALPRGQDQSEDAWKLICQKFAAWIVAEAKATLPPSSVVTTGSAATQTGPAAPVLLSLT